jgi:hypothetical protein
VVKIILFPARALSQTTTTEGKQGGMGRVGSAGRRRCRVERAQLGIWSGSKNEADSTLPAT